MLNRIVLGLNVVALLILVGERSNFNGGSLAWLSGLPWSTFGTETWAITASSTVSSDAIFATWLFITGLWVLATVGAWMLERHKAQHQSSDQSTSLGLNTTSASASSSAGSRVDPALTQDDVKNDSASPDAVPPVARKASKSSNDIADPALGSLFDDLSRQVDAFTPEARAELAKVKNALAALAQKDSGSTSA
ncbi:MAG: hypothetical protein VW440_06770 [Bordetella sp.]|jgi:hypothetical protein